jgi:hypothetical protein
MRFIQTLSRHWPWWVVACLGCSVGADSIKVRRDDPEQRTDAGTPGAGAVKDAATPGLDGGTDGGTDGGVDSGVDGGADGAVAVDSGADAEVAVECVTNASCNGGKVCVIASGRCECVAQAATGCGADGNLHWFDSCGVEGDETLDCCGVGCTGAACNAPDTQASTGCSAGNLFSFDSCGNPTTMHTDCCGAGCTSGSCNAPTPQASSACYMGDRSWYDACGALGTQRQSCCGMGCTGDSCNAPDPQASSSCYMGDRYWFDSCGAPTTERQDCCGAGCTGDSCSAPNPQASSSCYMGDRHWINACGVRTTKREDCCDVGCTGDACNAPNPNAASVCYMGDEYWQDSCGVRGLLKKGCCGQGCAGGTCNAPNPQASTTCQNGDVFYVNSCGVVGSLAQNCGSDVCVNDDCNGGCPPDMVPISGTTVCIDRYEGSVFSNSDCTGTQYVSLDGVPGYPGQITSNGLSGTVMVGGASYTLVAPTLTLYACSKAGVEPAHNPSWFQAKRLCEGRSKRMCTLIEWWGGCGTDAYAYGNTYSMSACNMDGLRGSVANAGSYPNCEGGQPNLFDMHGNLREWVDCASTFCPTPGGDYLDPSVDWNCTAYSGGPAYTSPQQWHGMRCCDDLP